MFQLSEECNRNVTVWLTCPGNFFLATQNVLIFVLMGYIPKYSVWCFIVAKGGGEVHFVSPNITNLGPSLRLTRCLIFVEDINLLLFFFISYWCWHICDGKIYISDTVICKYVFTILNTPEDTSLLTVKILLFVEDREVFLFHLFFHF